MPMFYLLMFAIVLILCIVLYRFTKGKYLTWNELAFFVAGLIISTLFFLALYQYY